MIRRLVGIRKSQVSVSWTPQWLYQIPASQKLLVQSGQHLYVLVSAVFPAPMVSVRESAQGSVHIE